MPVINVLQSLVAATGLAALEFADAMRVTKKAQGDEFDNVSNVETPDDVRSNALYNWDYSTTENYGADSTISFVGQFAEIRKTRDYSWHKYYPEFRQRIQDAIISYFLGDLSSPPPNPPWIVYTAGAMGAGKGHTVQSLIDNGLFLPVSFVHNDIDKIRAMLPENDEYIRRDPETAGSMTQQEAGFISEILTEAALMHGRHIVIDGSLQSPWWAGEMERVKTTYPERLLAILHVTASLDDVRANVAKRARITGRVVPDTVILKSFSGVPKNIERLSKLEYVDACYELRNVMGVNLPGVSTCQERLQLTKANASADNREWKFFRWLWTGYRSRLNTRSFIHAQDCDLITREHCGEAVSLWIPEEQKRKNPRPEQWIWRDRNVHRWKFHYMCLSQACCRVKAAQKGYKQCVVAIKNRNNLSTRVAPKSYYRRFS